MGPALAEQLIEVLRSAGNFAAIAAAAGIHSVHVTEPTDARSVLG
jgi:hypothetical protein